MIENEWTKKIRELENENAQLKETIHDLRWDNEEYQKKLDRVAMLALSAETAIKRIRNKI